MLRSLDLAIGEQGADVDSTNRPWKKCGLKARDLFLDGLWAHSLFSFLKNLFSSSCILSILSKATRTSSTWLYPTPSLRFLKGRSYLTSIFREWEEVFKTILYISLRSRSLISVQRVAEFLFKKKKIDCKQASSAQQLLGFYIWSECRQAPVQYY